MAKRRAWGSVQKKGRVWYGVYDGPKKDGKRKPVWERAQKAGFPNTRQGALDLLAVRKAQIVKGDWDNPAARLPFADLAQEFVDVLLPLRRDNTQVVYKLMLNNHLIPAFGSIDTRQMDSPVLQRFIGTKVEEGLCADYIRNLIQLVKNVIRFGHKHGRLRQMPVFYLVFPKSTKKEIDPFTRDEATALMDAAEQWRPLIACAIWTGMRQGEILGAEWSNLDADGGTYTVRHNLNRRLELAPTKTGDVGDVWVSEMLLREFDAQKRFVAQCQLGAKDWEASDLIFPRHVDGRPMRHTTVNSAHNRICEKAGVRYRSFHTYRHTCASLLIDQKESIKLVQRQLRHEDVMTTLRTYAHLMPEAGPEAFRKFDEAMGF